MNYPGGITYYDAVLSGGSRILSRPMKVHWAGWESDTRRLQQAGWQLSMNQNVERMSMQVGLQYEGGRGHFVRGYGEIADRFNYERAVHDHRYLEEIELGMQLGGDVIFQGYEAVMLAPIDAQPQMTGVAIQSMSDLACFAPSLARTRQLIVPEETVPDLLERILKMQGPARAARYAEQVQEERFSRVEQRHKFHAQIVSLAA